MDNQLFAGDLVRLVGLEPTRDAALFSKWGRDGEYVRLLDSDPPRLWSAKAVEKWLEKDKDKEPPDEILFMIHTRAENLAIGFVGLDGINWVHGEAWMGIGIGDRRYWGQGYGTEAIQLLLEYAFSELNLFRVTLNVFAYNERAVRSYEKAGFKIEGRARGALKRDGKRWDLVYMGILRPEWEGVYK
jgi:RimJ/RimL family protein N-acetyltransferase